MVVLGFDEPPWVTILRERGAEIAAAVMAEVRTVRGLTVEAAGGRVIATGTPTHHDRYSTAWMITEALTELWSGLADDSVSLRVIIEALQVDVPATYFTEAVFTRRRWATLSASRLVHATVHETDSENVLRGNGPNPSR